MTTKEAAAQYLREHLEQVSGKGYAVFNPHNKSVKELPFIIGFNNGGSDNFWTAVSISEDGVGLGSHLCSDELYMLNDLGILEGTRPDRHETYQKHYPDGYRMDFVSFDNVMKDPRLLKAFELNKAKVSKKK